MKNIFIKGILETHTKNGDVSQCNIGKIFTTETTVKEILDWANKEADAYAYFVADSFNETNIKNDKLNGIYTLVKNLEVCAYSMEQDR